MTRIRWQERVVVDNDIHHGDPCIKGTRVPVSMIVGSLADGMTYAQIRAEYPQLSTEDISAALAYIAQQSCTPEMAQEATSLRSRLAELEAEYDISSAEFMQRFEAGGVGRLGRHVGVERLPPDVVVGPGANQVTGTTSQLMTPQAECNQSRLNRTGNQTSCTSATTAMVIAVVWLIEALVASTVPL